MRAITKPKGFKEYKFPENGFSMYYPETWSVDKVAQFPAIRFAAEDGTNVFILTGKLEKDEIVEYEKDPLQLQEFIEKIFGYTFKDFECEEKSTIASHGRYYPMFVNKKAMVNIILKQIQVFIFDEQARKIHIITFTTKTDDYEETKPLWEKMLSTFQILEY